jgi:hypothetical protein
MNERIRELALQAANELADLFSPGFFDDRMVNDVAEINRKFAELIVGECLTFVEPMPGSGDIDDLALEAAREGIKEHFGVEE